MPHGVRDLVAWVASTGAADRGALRRVALESADPLVVGNAVAELDRLGAFVGDAELARLLEDNRPRVRHEVALALGASGRSDGAALLAATLESAAEDFARVLVMALRRNGSAEAREALARHARRRAGSASADLAALPPTTRGRASCIVVPTSLGQTRFSEESDAGRPLRRQR